MQGQQAANAWRVLALLFLANLFNFFDRTIPAIIIEPIRKEWGLSDLEIGFVGSAFTIVYAIAGVPLGRWADTRSRRKIMGWGLAAWSALTGATGLAWSFASFLVIRLFVGIGEASYGPAATSTIGDLFPPHKRSRAMGIFMLGLPLGLVLCYFTVGAMVKFFDSWRAPFFIAMVPGLILALALFMMDEPARGAAEERPPSERPIDRPIRSILRIRTLWWIVAAGVASNMAAYAANTFMVPLLQRFFRLELASAAVATGVILGVSGLIGLTAGGAIADRMHQFNERGRLAFGAISLAVAAALTFLALKLGRDEFALFTALFAAGWLLQYNFYTCVYPAIQDVVEPRLRSTAMAIYLAALYLLGGAGGPVVVGVLSDRSAAVAQVAAQASTMTEEFKAVGLHDAMIVIPVFLLLAGVAMWVANGSFGSDAAAMKRGAATAVAPTL